MHVKTAFKPQTAPYIFLNSEGQLIDFFKDVFGNGAKALNDDGAL